MVFVVLKLDLRSRTHQRNQLAKSNSTQVRQDGSRTNTFLGANELRPILILRKTRMDIDRNLTPCPVNGSPRPGDFLCCCLKPRVDVLLQIRLESHAALAILMVHLLECLCVSLRPLDEASIKHCLYKAKSLSNSMPGRTFPLWKESTNSLLWTRSRLPLLNGVQAPIPICQRTLSSQLGSIANHRSLSVRRMELRAYRRMTSISQNDIFRPLYSCIRLAERGKCSLISTVA